MTAAASSPESALKQTDGFDFKAYLSQSKQLVEQALDASLGPERPESLREAMRYSLLAGGKRLRPILCWRLANWRGGKRNRPCRPRWRWR